MKGNGPQGFSFPKPLLFAFFFLITSYLLACNEIPHIWTPLKSLNKTEMGSIVFQQFLEKLDSAIGSGSSGGLLVLRPNSEPFSGVAEFDKNSPSWVRSKWFFLPDGSDLSENTISKEMKKVGVRAKIELDAIENTNKMNIMLDVSFSPVFFLRVEEDQSAVLRFLVISDAEEVIAIDEVKLGGKFEIDFLFNGFIPIAGALFRRLAVTDKPRQLFATWWLGENIASLASISQELISK